MRDTLIRFAVIAALALSLAGMVYVDVTSDPDDAAGQFEDF